MESITIKYSNKKELLEQIEKIKDKADDICVDLEKINLQKEYWNLILKEREEQESPVYSAFPQLLYFASFPFKVQTCLEFDIDILLSEGWLAQLMKYLSKEDLQNIVNNKEYAKNPVSCFRDYNLIQELITLQAKNYIDYQNLPKDKTVINTTVLDKDKKYVILKDGKNE
jgi:hypothetical protein